MAQGDAGIASLEAQAKIVKLGIWATLAVLVPIVAFYCLLFIAYLGYGFPSAALFGLITLANTVLYLLFCLTAIAALFWFYRAHANLRDAGLEGLNYSPAWAVGSWFIPFVNLVVPFTSTRELYNRSNGEEEWNAGAVADDVTSWWTCHLAAIFILAFTTLTFLVNAIPGVWVTTPPAADAGLNIAGFLLLAGSAHFLKKIVNSVTSAQRHGASSATVFD